MIFWVLLGGLKFGNILVEEFIILRLFCGFFLLLCEGCFLFFLGFVKGGRIKILCFLFLVIVMLLYECIFWFNFLCLFLLGLLNSLLILLNLLLFFFFFMIVFRCCVIFNFGRNGIFCFML